MYKKPVRVEAVTDAANNQLVYVDKESGEELFRGPLPAPQSQVQTNPSAINDEAARRTSRFICKKCQGNPSNCNCPSASCKSCGQPIKFFQTPKGKWFIGGAESGFLDFHACPARGNSNVQTNPFGATPAPPSGGDNAPMPF